IPTPKCAAAEPRRCLHLRRPGLTGQGMRNLMIIQFTSGEENRFRRPPTKRTPRIQDTEKTTPQGRQENNKKNQDRYTEGRWRRMTSVEPIGWQRDPGAVT